MSTREKAMPSWSCLFFRSRSTATFWPHDAVVALTQQACGSRDIFFERITHNNYHKLLSKKRKFAGLLDNDTGTISISVLDAEVRRLRLSGLLRRRRSVKSRSTTVDGIHPSGFPIPCSDSHLSRLRTNSHKLY
jgi:hypothetical protein